LVRAVVLIGVSQTGNLQTLKAVHDGVHAMEKWALGQGIDRDMIKVLSDENGPVEVARVKQAIKELVDLTTVQQLIVYFSGHGVNISRGEFWLLSGAPEDSNAAVNVAGSVELARTCGIRHVVMVSDACRTAPEGIQAQSIRGSEIFPNVVDSGLERPVDVFFACGLGDPALEVKNPKKAAAGYRAVYTDALVEALEGRRDVEVKDPDTLEPARLIEVEKQDGKRKGLVRPWPLSFYLRADVLERLIEADVKPGVAQTPVARINSRGTWLAEVPAPKAPKKAAVASDFAFPADSAPKVHSTVIEIARTSLTNALTGDPAAPAPVLYPPEARLSRPMKRIYRPFGPRHFETQCGFKVRGAEFASATGVGERAEIVDEERHILSVRGISTARSLLIEFAGGTGVVLPAIYGQVASITVEEGRVVNVTYEPVANSDLWMQVAGRSDQLRNLRSLMASSARLGVFRLKEEDSDLLAERMSVGDGVDLTMALYAAYAYHDRQAPDAIRRMQESISRSLHLRLFDLELLAGDLRGRDVASEADLFPFVPMLSQGWALLGAHRVGLPESLARLGDHRVESLWTLFDRQGVRLIRSALDDKEIG
jgi:hypothetical protein